MNALVTACNQTSNRHPVVAYGEEAVASACAELKEKKLVRFVHPSHGRSAIRYRHVVDETLQLDVRQRALMAVLLLRGLQTVGELRARTERMADFADVHDVERELERLATRADPLVARVRRQPGQKEDRYHSLLSSLAGGDGSSFSGGGPSSGGEESRRDGGGPLSDREESWHDGEDPTPPGERFPAGSTQSSGPEKAREPTGEFSWGAAPDAGDALRQVTVDVRAETAELRADVAALRAEVSALQASLDELRAGLGG
jgi:uncharacterized protein YceH (UPF0502 family)